MEKKNIFWIFALIFIILFTTTSFAIDSAIVEYETLSDNEGLYVLGKINMNMTKEEVETFNFDFGTVENSELFIRLNGEYVNLDEINEKLLPYNSLEYEFITKEALEKQEFFMIINSNYHFSKLIVKFSLPDRAVLSDKTSHGYSIFPTPTKYETDGRTIKAVWVYKIVKKGDEFAYYVSFEKPDYLGFYLISLVLPIGLIVLILSFGILIFVKFKKKQIKKQTTKRKKKTHKKITSKKVKKQLKTDLHLKEEEEQIYNILKQRRGSCEQGTLLVVSDFSKAKLSRILMEMEERKIIKKIRKGRKNYIFLK